MKKSFIKLIAIALLALMLASLLAACEQKNEHPAYKFKNAGIEIAVDMAVEGRDLTGLAGAGNAWTKAPEEVGSCGLPGVNKKYYYKGFELETNLPDDGKEYVVNIDIFDDSVITPEGIAIGASRDDVVAAYGEASKETSSALTYEAKGMVLQFLLNDGKVVRIKYLKNI